jgi:hypothetical protein
VTQLPLVLWIGILLIASGGLAWWANGPRDRLLEATTPGRLFVVFYLLLFGIGSLWLIVTGESNGPGPSLAAYGLAMFALGGAIGAWRWGVPVPGRGMTAEGLRPIVVVVLAGVGLAALATIAIEAGLPFLSGDALGSRAEFKGLVFDVFRWWTPPAALVALGLALVRPGAATRVAAVASIVLVVGVELVLASRALLFELGICAALVAWYGSRHIPLRGWFALVVIGACLFVGIQIARIGGSTGVADDDGGALGFATSRSINRILLIGPRTLEVAIKEVPAREPYFAGASYLRRLAVLIGDPPEQSLGYWLYARLFPQQLDGFAAPGVLGEAWLNGGPLLALPGMALLGLAGQALGRFLARLGPGIGDRVFAAVVTVAFARTYATSLNGFLATAAALTLWWLAVDRNAVRVLADVGRTVARTILPGQRPNAGPAAAPGPADA